MDPRDPSERVVMETQNAHEAYRAARERLDRRLGELNHVIREHAERQYKDRASWGFAGDISHVIEILDQAITFMGGSEGERAARLMGLKEKAK